MPEQTEGAWRGGGSDKQLLRCQAVFALPPWRLSCFALHSHPPPRCHFKGEGTTTRLSGLAHSPNWLDLFSQPGDKESRGARMDRQRGRERAWLGGSKEPA